MTAPENIAIGVSPVFVMRYSGIDTVAYARYAPDVTDRNFIVDLINWGTTSLSGPQLGWGGIEVVLRHDLARAVVDMAMAPDNGPATDVVAEWGLDDADPDRAIYEAVAEGRYEDAFRRMIAIPDGDYGARGTTEAEVRELALEGKPSLTPIEQAELDRVLNDMGVLRPEALNAGP